MKAIRLLSNFPVTLKLGVCAGLIGLVLALANGGHSRASQSNCPTNLPPAVITSSQVPPDVSTPLIFDGNGVPFASFDDYSWRAFIALVWPAQPQQRGVPDAGKQVSDAGPRVFETYKADWEVFQPKGAPPSAFNSYAGQSPCQNITLGFGDLVLASFTKFGNLGQASNNIFNPLVGPLVAQNNTYVRYLTGFNQIEFDQILNQQLYLRLNLNKNANVPFQNGAVSVKSAWIDMTNIPHPERYYTRTAYVLDLSTNSCSPTPMTVGLVGLHIVQKTPSRPQWIWSTFEQVDNIPQAGAVAPYTFNDGGPSPMPSNNPIPFPPPTTPTEKFNVTRLLPISPSTACTNALYQQALKNQNNSVWQFYQLTMTQWPKQPNMPQNPGAPGLTFPGSTPPATSAFANATLETFDQTNIRTGCMACHTLTQSASDFLWSLNVNAFPTPTPQRNGQPGTPALRQLATLLQTARAKAAPTPKPVPKPKRK